MEIWAEKTNVRIATISISGVTHIMVIELSDGITHNHGIIHIKSIQKSELNPEIIM